MDKLTLLKVNALETPLQRKSDIPLYLQLYEILRQRILNHEWAAGSSLPSELALCKEFGVARGTVRQALGELDQANYIRRLQGRGTIVIWGDQNLHSNESSDQIGFIVPYVRDSFVSTILLGMEQYTTERGMSITFRHVANSLDQQSEALESLIALQVAGVAIYPVNSVPTQSLQSLLRSGYPVVLIDRYLRGIASDYVISDNFGGALRATQHLIHLGHKRIGFISWRDPSISIEHRLQGYRRALSEAGLHFDSELTCEIESYPAIDSDPLYEFFTRKPRATALLAANDQIALAIYKAARAKRIRIPEDLALVGFDNLDFTPHLDVPLTTVAQDAYQIGQTAAEILMESIQKRATVRRQEIIPTQLIIRRSCGAFLDQPSADNSLQGQ